MNKYFLILFLLFTLIGCSKKVKKVDLKYTLEEFTNLAHATSPNKDRGDREIKFSDYISGANHLESQSLIYKRLVFFAISFETSEQARLEALRLNQYYSRNWLFDLVEGEPFLEDYVIETFKAINPTRRKQRIPKKTEGHGEAQAQGGH